MSERQRHGTSIRKRSVACCARTPPLSLVEAMHVSTRPSMESDTAFAREAYHRAYHEVVVRQFGQWDERFQDRFFEKSWASTEREIILADGERCGYASVESRSDSLHVRELVIHPQWQGKGIGTAFLRNLCEQAAARGVAVRLGTFHENRALALYKRLGFQEFARTETHVLLEWKR